jgi:hypothetical protein
MPEPLLCELYAHTTWSDGVLTPAELVDLYGSAGFDVLAITDHVVRDRPDARTLAAADHPPYLVAARDHDFFAWVARARLPVVANGDFRRPEHLATWKTLVAAEQSEEAVVDYLRSRRPVSLALVEPPVHLIARAA